MYTLIGHWNDVTENAFHFRRPTLCDHRTDYTDYLTIWRLALICVSTVVTQTLHLIHYQTTHTGLVYHAACLFTPQLLLVLIPPTDGGMARLSWPGWLVKYQDGADANWTSVIALLTGPDLDYCKYVDQD